MSYTLGPLHTSHTMSPAGSYSIRNTQGHRLGTAYTIADAQLWAAAPELVAIYQAARRLLTPDQCALLTEEEEDAFGRVEAILANAGATP